RRPRCVTMSGDQRVVRVCGVPSRLPDDLVCDKLHIHFLRPHNGGGELLRLVYPTREKGVAVLMFELEEVAERILKRKHQLEVGGQSFPLEVMRPQILNTVAGVGISGTQKQPRLLKVRSAP
ncbi:hypothetical protein FKM82_026045, partial [Ascaphus truei]